VAQEHAEALTLLREKLCLIKTGMGLNSDNGLRRELGNRIFNLHAPCAAQGGLEESSTTSAGRR
jgi:hypothetical protein